MGAKGQGAAPVHLVARGEGRVHPRDRQVCAGPMELHDHGDLLRRRLPRPPKRKADKGTGGLCGGVAGGNGKSQNRKSPSRTESQHEQSERKECQQKESHQKESQQPELENRKESQQNVSHQKEPQQPDMQNRIESQQERVPTESVPTI